MREKPIYLTLFPLIAILIAIGFPLQIHLIYEVPLSDIKRIFAMLTPLNISTMIFLVIAATLAMKLRDGLYKVLPVLLIMVMINNIFVGLYGQDYTLVQGLLSFGVFAVILAPFYTKNIKNVVKDPRYRWWQTPKRINVNETVQIHSDLLDIYSESMNMSTTGMFAKIGEKNFIKSIPVNKILHITLQGRTPIKLKARVARKIEQPGALPTGLGLEFIQNASYEKYFLPWLKKKSENDNKE